MTNKNCEYIKEENCSSKYFREGVSCDCGFYRFCEKYKLTKVVDKFKKDNPKLVKGNLNSAERINKLPEKKGNILDYIRWKYT